MSEPYFILDRPNAKRVILLYVDGPPDSYTVLADWYISDGRLISFDSYVDGVEETPPLLTQAYKFIRDEAQPITSYVEVGDA